jgi:hypothetical protein
MIEHMVKDLQDDLTQRGLQVAALSGSSANQEFIQAAFVERDHKVGAKYGLQYAEEFHYIGPDRSLDEYLQRNAKPV